MLDNNAASLAFSSGNNNLTLGGGVDTVQTTGGVNQITLGQGQAILANNGANDTVQLGSLSPDQLWFSQSGADLVVNVLGSSESLTVQNWFNSQANQISAFVTDGLTLTDSNVAPLVQAMAAFAVPASGQVSYTTQEQQALAPLLATSWT